ncbi:tail fiber protein [Rhizobium phage RHEph06]|uniref:Dit-like phage tail protein N-terminal domain-containing protein n=4 Tax=Kleczkowskavirus RHEph4 TaxID=1921526 RepID=A0A7S5URY9_9CAUD|nr:tail fiber protein [Rhizobium phage RHEph06]YP_009598470.1 tail fiber protein [Rhizobium phage RHEph04]AGC35790.1 hypothetical protein RHEph05_gp023 [Rhizobium phage RHEph05]QIG67653.1 hypothetical protein EVB51_036 [Rhizobium phage RHph_Y17]QIG68972.1 hypothetical protein EVB73_036 [Rhizobium phage RHph_Y3_43]QIG69521.1 hypothetical protein EVB80_038 [Rhizobium phage RHph_I36]QIG75395.1 hypothetical protein EVC17_038 [Rhizobium phage RHph_Y1_1]QIG75945.1 hypothetical protein EVC21_038 [R
MTAIIFSNTIGPVPISVVISEEHESTIGITEQPVETGAKITDHAYVEPKKLSLEFGDENAVATYNALVRFQESRVPFSIISGLYVYNNMLIRAINVTRDSTYSRVLSGRVDLQEVIIVSTAYVSTEGEQNDPQSTGKAGGKKSTQSARPTTEKAGDAVTGDRAAGTTMRGDAGVKTIEPAKNSSILNSLTSSSPGTVSRPPGGRPAP